MIDKRILLAYFRQQQDLSMPDMVFSSVEDIDTLFIQKEKESLPSLPFVSKEKVTAASVPADNRKNVQNPQANDQSISSRLQGLKTITELAPSIKMRSVKTHAQSAQSSMENSYAGVITYDQKRDALKNLYFEGCERCVLSKTRKKYVFGAGSAGAPVMVIGEAPGADEDDQGLPFVGAAGQLLTSMLKAINLDRKKDVFITNILKCRPPENRSPESSEIITCLPILAKQIDIIKPKAILLLGRIAAHSLLGSTESIQALRSKTHMYKNIPAMVIYHPAALLRNAEYKRPAWEDLKKFQQLLADLGVYESAKV